jgi:uroporphyrin-3 C-methyltransferase
VQLKSRVAMLHGGGDAAVPEVAAIRVPASQVNAAQSGAVQSGVVAAVDVAQSGATQTLAAERLVNESWWNLAWNKVVLWSKAVVVFVAKELASVVSIQRVTDANALLMSPEQGAQLRANLRTRVLTAQMALLMHQPSVWRTEITTIEASLAARYDPKAVDTVSALRLVRELASVPVSAALPEMSDSIAALEAVRLQEPNNKSEN